MKTAAFLDVTTCSLVDVCRCFGGTSDADPVSYPLILITKSDVKIGWTKHASNGKSSVLV
jgi:hypothetical protein